MEIGILTYYEVHNHGAVLQANALKKVVESQGHSVRFLRFDRDYRYISSKQANKYRIGFGSVPFYLQYAKEKGLGNIVYNYKKRNILNIFRNENFDLRIPYDEFYGDLTIIGSDEVFSLEIGYNTMMFGRDIHSKRVISYAASFGPTTIEDIINKDKIEQISAGLKTFSSIGVRDDNSKQIVKTVCKREASLVSDPVLLYGYEDEMKEFNPRVDNYIVIYAYDGRMNDPIEVKAIMDFAKNRNLKVYSVGYYHKWCDKNINATPNELLGWIRNAKLTITDTFHGSVISIICNTPMIVKLRGNANKLAFLLKEYGLSNRIVEGFDEMEVVFRNNIDFGMINQKVSEKRHQSNLFLQQAIER